MLLAHPDLAQPVPGRRPRRPSRSGAWCSHTSPAPAARLRSRRTPRRLLRSGPGSRYPGSVPATGTTSAAPAPARRDRPARAGCPPWTRARRSGPAPSPGTPHQPARPARAGHRRPSAPATAAARTSRPPGCRRSPRRGARQLMPQARRPPAWPARPGGPRSSRRHRRSAALRPLGLPGPARPDPATAGHELPTTAEPAPSRYEPTPDAPPARSAGRGASRSAPRPPPTTCGPCERTARPPANGSTPTLPVTIPAPRRPRTTRSQACEPNPIYKVARVRSGHRAAGQPVVSIPSGSCSGGRRGCGRCALLRARRGGLPGRRARSA